MAHPPPSIAAKAREQQQGPSVFDSPLERAIKWLAGLAGVDDPASQVLALMNPVAPKGMETAGPLVKAIQTLAGKGKAAIKAYHGSPHDFDKFELSKIGTGEGAQAYGHGLYFAEAEDTARAYKTKLAGAPEVSVAGQRVQQAQSAFDSQTPEQIVAKRIALRRKAYDELGWADTPETLGKVLDEVEGSINEALEMAVHRKDEPVRQSLARQRAALGLMREQGIEAPLKGRMYEVAIHADPETFLDWDKPLNQQSVQVQTALGKLGVQPSAEAWQWVPHQVTQADVAAKTFGPSARVGQWTTVQKDAGGNIQRHSGQLHAGRQAAENNAAARSRLSTVPQAQKGEALYRDLAARQSKPGAFPEIEIPDRAAATEKLKGAGVSGIKYLDQGSRAAGEGSRNYVVFDDALVTILKKYGVALPVIEALRQQAQAHGGQVSTADVAGAMQ